MWDDHLIDSLPEGADLIAIDSEVMYEGTRYQTFAALRQSGHRFASRRAALALPDHTIRTHTAGRAPRSTRKPK